MRPHSVNPFENRMNQDGDRRISTSDGANSGRLLKAARQAAHQREQMILALRRDQHLRVRARDHCPRRRQLDLGGLANIAAVAVHLTQRVRLH